MAPAKKTGKSVTVTLESPQPKKHVVRYDSSADDAAIANAYITKVALAELGNPERVTVTITAA